MLIVILLCLMEVVLTLETITRWLLFTSSFIEITVCPASARSWPAFGAYNILLNERACLLLLEPFDYVFLLKENLFWVDVESH